MDSPTILPPRPQTPLGIPLDEVKPDQVIEKRGIMRKLTVKQWEDARKKMEEDPTIERMRVATHTFPADKEEIPSLEWFLYKHDGSLWMQVVRYGRVVKQNPYELPQAVPRGIWVEDNYKTVQRILNSYHWDSCHADILGKPDMEEIVVGLHNDQVDGEYILSWRWILYRHEGRIWSRTEYDGEVVSQQPYVLNEEESLAVQKKWGAKVAEAKARATA
jgi:hypothetical protein